MEKIKLEKSIERNKEIGRVCFSIADSLGSVGKALAMGSMTLIILGAVSALGADICQSRMEKAKRNLRNFKK